MNYLTVRNGTALIITGFLIWIASLVVVALVPALAAASAVAITLGHWVIAFGLLVLLVGVIIEVRNRP